MIGLLEIRRRKTQFALIASVFVLIAYLVMMINGLGIGLNQLAGSALLNMDADAIAYSSDAGRSVIRSELSQETLDRIQTAPGVEESAPLVYTAASYERSSGKISSAALLGYDPGTIAEPPVTAGRSLTEEDHNGVLADATFLDDSGLAIGDTLPLRLRLQTVELTIVGEIDEGAFFFQPAIYLLRSTLLDLKYGPATGGERPVASIALTQGDDSIRSGDGFELVDKQTAFDNIEGVSGQQATVTSLQAFGYIIGAMIIGVFFYVLTLQKIPQFGVLKALGASNRYIIGQLLTQVLVIAGIGIGLSLLLALVTERGLQSLPDTVPIAFTSRMFIITCVALLVTALIGALFSARQVLRIDPIIALGQQQ
ncbi:MAG TPA: ABC transporter permease [Thermomicrobiales bacterium]|nr:ABC transporter permease [Thermomicrobiales bacterium]